MSRESGPAFPVEGMPTHLGMTLRDYFAAQVVPIFIGRIMDRFGKDDMSVSHAVAAEAAYCLADAMLAERDK